MKKYLIRGFLGAIGLAIGIVGVFALREATLSTHQPVSPDSQIELIVHGSVKGNERSQSLTELVDAQVQACRLEVNSDVVGEIEDRGDGEFRFVLQPAMDETDRRQFRGCVEDWMIDHLRVNVVSLEDIA